MVHVLRVQRRARSQRGSAPGSGLALPGRYGEFAKKPRPAARLAKRRSFGRAAALPPLCVDMTASLPRTVGRTDRGFRA